MRRYVCLLDPCDHKKGENELLYNQILRTHAETMYSNLSNKHLPSPKHTYAGEKTQTGETGAGEGEEERRIGDEEKLRIMIHTVLAPTRLIADNKPLVS